MSLLLLVAVSKEVDLKITGSGRLCARFLAWWFALHGVGAGVGVSVVSVLVDSVIVVIVVGTAGGGGGCRGRSRAGGLRAVAATMLLV